MYFNIYLIYKKSFLMMMIISYSRKLLDLLNFEQIHLEILGKVINFKLINQG